MCKATSNDTKQNLPGTAAVKRLKAAFNYLQNSE
jgi:hypothetical protein